MLDDLSLLSTEDIVRKYRLKRRHVVAKRNELGIPSKFTGGYKARTFSPAMIALLGKRPDHILARNFAMSKSSIRDKRVSLGIPSHKSHRNPWNSEALALLGKISDFQLARKLGIASPSVLLKRRKLGISPAPYRKKKRWSRQMLEKLGAMSDAKAAALLGMGISTIARKRKALGRPAYTARRLP